MFALFALASFEAATPLPLAFQSLSPTLAAARRLFELADRQPPVPEPAATGPRISHHGYRFEKVDFQYPGGEAVLREIDLDIPEGSSTAIIGPTGSGKSTLLQLMVRFQLPTGGSLSFGGIDLRHWSGEALRERLAVADQQSHLFIGTIRQNLLLARPDASDEALEAACRTAQLSDWIDSLPRGLDTEIGEAALRISGGEAKRLAIARALLREAPVLILDEPTEGLDPATAHRFMKGVLAHCAHRTLVMISHQLNELPLMDQVVLLDGGRILASGNHQELLESSEPYRALMALAPISAT